VPDVGCQDLRKLVNILRDMNQRNLNPAETIAKLRRTQGLNDYYKSIKVPPGVNYEPLQKLAQLEEDARNSLRSGVGESADSGAKVVTICRQRAVEHVVHILTLHEAKGKGVRRSVLVDWQRGLFPADSVRVGRTEATLLCGHDQKRRSFVSSFRLSSIRVGCAALILF